VFPRLFEFGDFSVPTYGALVASAFLLGVWLTGRLAQRRGYDQQRIMDLAVYCVFAGMVGAKLLMYAFDWQYYLQNPGEILSLTTLRAAGVFQGGFLAALIFAVIYMSRNGLPFLQTADIFTPGLSIGHAVGRLGCFAAGCCYGVAADLPWAVTYSSPYVDGAPLGIPLHPSQLYEALGDLAIGALLWKLAGQQRAPGFLLGLYLTLYSLLRFAVELTRQHQQSLALGLSLTQWISLATLLFGLVLLLRKPAAKAA
jgi:phosphatidylglycerol---prolipoprotein diacylglyceryl transferase